jgi:hypothetical protein
MFVQEWQQIAVTRAPGKWEAVMATEGEEIDVWCTGSIFASG